MINYNHYIIVSLFRIISIYRAYILLVFLTFADLHWKIQNKVLNEDLFHTHITSSAPSKQQRRNNVKNAKLVLTLKEISLVEFSQFSPIFQLQKKITTNTGKEEQKWEKLRTFKLPRPGKVQYVVIGVKSLVRKYLKVIVEIEIMIKSYYFKMYLNFSVLDF